MLPPLWLLVVPWFRKSPLLNVSVPWLVSVPPARFWKPPAAEADAAAGLVIGRALVDVLTVAERDRALLVSVPPARFWKSPAARLTLPPWLLVVPWLTY